MVESNIRLPDPEKLVVSSSPHVHTTRDVSRIMGWVIVALLPACLSGVIYFGWRALWVVAVCILSCLGFEALFCRMAGRPSTLRDLSAVVTGLLLGLNLSAITPWWVCVIGSLLAMGLGKHVYGGLGYNPFNPALVGRVGLLIGFPKLLTTWVQPTPFNFFPDAVTTATPLGIWKTEHIAGTDYWNWFLGNMPGCIGETSELALLIGGLLLIALNLIRWQVPAAFIGTVALIAAIMHGLNPALHPPPLFHLVTGGLFLGAFFMATDMVTSPITRWGGLIFGVGCGVITCVIRLWGGYPEGVSFAILIMNALTPAIDRLTMYKPFGFQSTAAAPAKAG